MKVALPAFYALLLPSSTQSWIQPKPFFQRFKRPKSSFLVSSRFSKAPDLEDEEPTPLVHENAASLPTSLVGNNATMPTPLVEKVASMPTSLLVRPLDMLRSSSKIFKVEQMTNFFKLSPRIQIHAASFAFFFASVGLLSVEPVARVVLNVLSMLPCASWAPVKFDPLGASNWVVHFIILAISLELPYGFYSLMRKSDSIQKKRIYKGFFAAYAVTYFQSIFTLLSHAFIAHSTPLEEMLDILFKACLRTYIFGTGVSVQWGAWALVPTFVGVNMGVVEFGNWFGRVLAGVLALFSMYKYFIPEIPPLFRYSFFGLGELLWRSLFS
ncbi:hypothetical protein QTG54_011243 [Skeletonema marinoi]|uniref:Derlin n=1 Tax=Skeletonema marinoi TaxID=267567 RepID=A0AAD8Y1M6_9STRA|nr:hypothetical protein QTG54_011243 [Skeletonema marinoi]